MSKGIPKTDTRVHFSTDPKTGKMILSRGNQTATFDVGKAGASTHVDAPRSRAAQRLARLRGETPDAGSGPVRVEIDGDPEPWFVREMGLEHVTQVGLYAGRDKNGVLKLHERGKFTSLLAGMLFVGVVDEDGEDYFESFEDAFNQAADVAPDVVIANSVLFNAILAANPGILPECKPLESQKKIRLSRANGSANGSRETVY